MKKIVCSILAFIIVLTINMSAFAAGTDQIYDNNSYQTDQFLVTITRPDGDESTFKKSYVVCGVSDKEDIEVHLLKFDSSSGSYIDFPDVDGNSSWGIGSSGVFMKEVTLSEGANHIRIAAYKKSDNGIYKLGENLQINEFTVTVLNESIKDKIKNGVLNITDMLKDLFGDKK